MKKIIEKRNYIILGIIVVIIILLASGIFKTKEYMKSFEYFDEIITIKLYSNKNMSNVFEEIDKIYSKYNEYYENDSNNDDKELIEMLKYGKEWYEKTDGLIDITTDELITKVEDDEDFTFKSTMKSLDFNDKSTLNNINIDTFIGSYATKEVINYLKNEEIDKYLINEDGNIITGNHYNDGKYKISINDSSGKVVEIVNMNNLSMAVKGNTSAFKSYMVNPLTSQKNSENKLVAVISSDINEANMLANALYLMDIDKGKEFINNYNAEALWEIDGKIQMTDGFKKYIN